MIVDVRELVKEARRTLSEAGLLRGQIARSLIDQLEAINQANGYLTSKNANNQREIERLGSRISMIKEEIITRIRES